MGAPVFESAVPNLRSTFALILLLYGVACRPAEETGAPTSETTQDFAIEGHRDAGGGCVWVVDGPGTDGRLYLCGTIHILREEDYPLAPGYEAAYANSDKLVLELPPGSGSGNELASRMRELGLYSSDASLDSKISPDLWEKVKAWGATHGLSASSLNRYRPWFLSLIIASMEYAALGAQPDMGVDQHFEERALKDGKPGEGLETVEFQLQMFAGLSGDMQRNLLEQTLSEVTSMGEQYETMIEAWKTGDITALHEMLFEEAERFPELMELFLTDRNHSWIDALSAMLERGEKNMVLVGAGHLGSNQGLLALLEDRGYRVRHYREPETSEPSN